MKYTHYLFLGLLLLGCQAEPTAEQTTTPKEAAPQASIETTDFGDTADGTAQLYTLKNKQGMQVTLTNYGGIIRSVEVPDKKGQLADVVLGFDSLGNYLLEHPYFGAFVGRYANRIGKGRFRIGETTYELALNNGENTLHGGRKGFDKKLWQAKPLEEKEAVGVELTGTSVDMEEGYPGNLQVRLRYWLNNRNELIMEYEATTNKTTIANFTNHCYFNLKGAGNGDILDHELMVAADQFTPVGESLIPTGELRSVENTPFDFRQARAIGARLDMEKNEQLKFGNGYDHNLVLSKKGPDMILGATVYEPTSGRYLEVFTTEPGIQFYCGNWLDGSMIGKGGKAYKRHYGLCLETQHFPDSPNKTNFPSTLLEPGETYRSRTIYRFSTKESISSPQ